MPAGKYYYKLVCLTADSEIGSEIRAIYFPLYRASVYEVGLADDRVLERVDGEGFLDPVKGKPEARFTFIDDGVLIKELQEIEIKMYGQIIPLLEFPR